MGNERRKREPSIPWLAPSGRALVLANLVPIFGVLFFDWQVFPLVFLFWLENVIIGGFNVLKMIFSRSKEPIKLFQKIFMIPFFCVHYGGFVTVHGIFVIHMIGRYGGLGIDIPTVLGIISQYHLAYAATFLGASHGFSFVWNYLRGGERDRLLMGELMFGPYKRVVVLHIFIIFGGFLLLHINAPPVGILLLVLIKIVVDLFSHKREHQQRISGMRKRMQRFYESRKGGRKGTSSTPKRFLPLRTRPEEQDPPLDR